MPAVGQKILHDVAAALHIVDHRLHIGPLGVVVVHAFQPKGRVKQDTGQRVVDLVGHPGGELPQRGHLLGLGQLGLGLLELLLHGQLLAQIGVNADGSHCFTVFVDDRSRQIHGDGVALGIAYRGFDARQLALGLF